MDTLHDRLAELADHAPTGGVPAAELWARGTRARRRRVAALAATVLVVGAVGTGIGVRLADDDGHRARPVPAGPVGLRLPIEYPAGEELPDLGEAPGPVAAVWVVPRSGSAPEVVGLVAGTGRFGTLPVDVSFDESDPLDPGVALSPDGRRIAYRSSGGDLLVRNLASGAPEVPLPGIETRAGFVWIDATHLFGHVAGGSDVDGWVWRPGTSPQLINQLTYDGHSEIWPDGVGRDVRVIEQGGGPRSCSAPTLENNTPDPWTVPQLCDVLAILETVILIGHGNADRLAGQAGYPTDGNGAVVALSLRGSPMSFNGRAVPPVVVTAGAPERVAFAVDVIDRMLVTGGSAS